MHGKEHLQEGSIALLNVPSSQITIGLLKKVPLEEPH